MPDYISHIILLPQGAGWEWYEAVKEYLQKFRVTVTQSADDAGSFHGLSHTITVVDMPGAWPGDIVAWLEDNYPEAELDVIRVSNPKQLSGVLGERVDTNDRYGKQQMWLGQPLEVQEKPLISQRFAASPWDYRKWRFPGHEGTDFAVPVGTPVRACADGKVTRVDTDHPNDPENYPYGNQVRIEHQLGGTLYKTFYAHLSSVRVREDQWVRRGEVIGRSGDTGNVTGPHLHLAFKRRGELKDRPGFRDPYAVSEFYLDPEHFLFWPDGSRLRFDASLPHIYGVHEDHDAAAARLMRDQDVKGYILWTEGIGSDPDDPGGGRNYAQLTTDYGHTTIVRLNYGYEHDLQHKGTIPHSSLYSDFAERCANWVARSQGCRIWVIGNEPNNPREHPQGESITASRFARCFDLVYRAIKRVQPDSIVVPGAIDPTNAAMGDCRQYFWDMLAEIDDLDGLAIHAYTHGPDPRNIVSSRRFEHPPLTWQYYHFRMFETFMEAVPESLRHLPVYLTETNHLFKTVDGDWGWVDQNEGWVWAMYERVDEWNRRGGQQIHCALLYRYPPIDHWVIHGKQNVIQDFRQSMTLRYRPYIRGR